MTKPSRLLSKTDCFQLVAFCNPCNPQFRCRGVSIINFACVMTDSSPLKNSQTAAEGLQSSTLGTPESLRACWGRLRGTPYSVRELCRFLTKLSRLLSKTDCFQPVSFDTLCNPQFRCRGVSIISFACVMTDSSTLKNSQTAAEGLQSSIFGVI